MTARTREDAAEILQSKMSEVVDRAVTEDERDTREKARTIILEAVDDANQVPSSRPDGLFHVPKFEADFIEAPDIEHIAKRLIAEHNRFWDLRSGSRPFDIRVKYMWRKKGGSSGGRTVLGRCQRLSGLTKVLSGDADYLVWIAADSTRDHVFTNQQMEALVFHELCHVQVDEDEDGNVTCRVVGHDAELFNAEIEEYGLWKLDLERVGRTVQQLGLWDEAAD